MKKFFWIIAAWAAAATIAVIALGVSIFGIQDARQSAERECEGLRLELQQMTAAQTQHLQVMSENQTNIEKYGADLTAADERIAALEAELTEAYARAGQAEQLLETGVARDEKVVELQKQIEELNGKISEAEQKDAERVESITSLQTQIAEKDAALTKLNADHEETVNALTDTEEELAGKAALLTETTQQRDTANEQVAVLTDERDAANEQVIALTAERDGLNQQLTERTGERDAANEQIAALQKQIEDDKKTVNDAEQAIFDAVKLKEEINALKTVNAEQKKQLEQNEKLAREHESTAARVDTLLSENEALTLQLAESMERMGELEAQLSEYVELPKEVFEGTHLSFECPEGVTASERNNDVYFTHALSGIQGRIYVWMDDSETVTPEQMDIRQMLEYVMDTMYGSAKHPKTQSIEGMEGYRFSSESAYADGTPCTMEICLIRGEDAFYYMEVEGSAEQMQQVQTLTDEVLATLTLK